MSAAIARSDILRPLAKPVFAALWVAVLLGNIGNWMETVGAQWLLVSQNASPTLIALVQTADTLPVMLLALPAGVLADVFDRRQLLIGTQLYLAVVSIVLTIVTATGQMTPGLLLVLTFLGGAGAGVTAPAWQGLIPDLVDRANLRSASILGSLSVNLARAVGPALAGVLIAVVGVAPVFGLNSATFLLFAGVLLWAAIPRAETAFRRERFLPGLRAGGAYVRHAPIVRSILVRAALFLLPAVATWALLPLIATDGLGLDSAGYGVLLGALGVGAIIGVVLLGRIGERYSDETLLRASSVVYAATMAVLVFIPILLVAIATLLIAGACWVAVLSKVNATLQVFLPGWVRARGLAVYIMVLFGAQAIGAAGWGVVATQAGLTPTFLIAAMAMLVGAIAARRWPLRDVSGLDRRSAAYWATPQLAFEPELDVGPVLVRVDYRVALENVDAFVAAMELVERSRRRTGAAGWRLYRDGGDPSQFIELFEVASWEEHLRQHANRLTGTDAAMEAQADALASSTPVTRHYFPVDAVPEALEADPPSDHDGAADA